MDSSSPHIILFPFMSKGHTIPLLHLSRLLFHRGATVTIFTTPANLPFITTSLSDAKVSKIISLPFPENIPGIPNGTESTDALPSMSLFPVFATATKEMQPHFEMALESLPKATFMISDGFLFWTLDSCNKFNIPRLVFYGMNNYAMTISRIVGQNELLMKAKTEDEEFVVNDFPWIKLTRQDFVPPFTDREPKGIYFEFVMQAAIATTKSYGIVVNSFYELEHKFCDYYNLNYKPKSWSVGPLCLAEKLASFNIKSEGYKKPHWIKWLDSKLEQGETVLYVGFGSQAEISSQQVNEIKTALEKSQVNFLWVVRNYNQDELSDDGFEERVKERGLMVKEWVDQREILEHKSVEGFLSHCGWNSVLESICAKVPIIAWPMMAEQPLNARMVVEELKIGLRIKTHDGSLEGFVKAEVLENMVRELMGGEMGKEARKRVEEFSEAAMKAIEECGSSWCALNALINELHNKRSA
ncbi:glycosyltransferase [Lithospermum erythrorhizon]|uniref:Glycosyltransferase n=1 Tax=Lithospermum erythrorhizon TaxID=34254 RepID=A0AAV3R1R9_LITER